MLHALRLELPLEARGDHRTITAEAPDPFGAYFVASTSATLSEDSYPNFTDHRCARYHAAGVLPYIVIATPGMCIPRPPLRHAPTNPVCTCPQMGAAK